MVLATWAEASWALLWQPPSPSVLPRRVIAPFGASSSGDVLVAGLTSLSNDLLVKHREAAQCLQSSLQPM